LRKAIAQFEQAVELARLAKAQDQQALSLLLLGRIYSALGEKQKALDYYNQALPLRRAVGDRDGEAVTLNNIGVLFALQKQPELAIVFYKHSRQCFRISPQRHSSTAQRHPESLR
jgi:tetratricopeptide (TPR) repeat protein